MNVRTNNLTKLGVARKVRSDKIMPHTLETCGDCGIDLPHALLSKAHLCYRCSWLRMVKVFELAWLRKRQAYALWQVSRDKSI